MTDRVFCLPLIATLVNSYISIILFLNFMNEKIGHAKHVKYGKVAIHYYILCTFVVKVNIFYLIQLIATMPDVRQHQFSRITIIRSLFSNHFNI